MSDADDEDARWVIQAQCGDRDAMELVLRRVQPPVRRYVLRLVGATAADDVGSPGMADEQETALRNSLDAVDRGRRWAMLGVAALFVATVLALGALIGTAAANRAPSHDVGAFKVLFVAAIAEMLLMACCAAIVMFHTTRLTRVVLRRIDLSRRG